MSRLSKIAERVLQTSRGATQDDYKRVAELCIALHYTTRFFSGGGTGTGQSDGLGERLIAYLHRDAFLRMPVNPFLVLQNVTPYVFLRAEGARSEYYEALLEVFRAQDTSVREGYSYRALERGYLLFKLGEGPRLRPFEDPIFQDAAQLYAFNRDMGYAMTHTVMYATDFGAVEDPVDHVRDILMLLCADSFERNDIDLCFECLLCLTSQCPEPALLADMEEIAAILQSRNSVMLESLDPGLDYHPMLVHEMLRGRMLQITGRDLLYAKPARRREPGPIRALAPLWNALNGKDPEAIAQAYGDWSAVFGERAFLRGLVSRRFDYLKALAEGHILFEREFSHLCARRDGLYPEFLSRLARLA